MSKVGLILVTFAVDPERLFESAEPSRHDLSWFVFHHGPASAVEDKMYARAARAYALRFTSLRENRGLARSWNEGLRQSLAAENTHHVILNDDLFFTGAGIDDYIDWLESQPAYEVAFVNGVESGQSPYSGQVRSQGLSCAAISANCLTKVGYFDETFRPAYYEDCDYLYRLRLARLGVTHSEKVLVEHERSSTIRASQAAADAVAAAVQRNFDYYGRKWGGPPDAERFTAPFDRPDWADPLTWEMRSDPYGFIAGEVDHHA